MRALLLHGIGNSPELMWRYREWLESLGWEVEAPSLLGHGGRGPAPSYALEAYAADLAGTGPWELVLGHSLGGAVATVLAAREPGWAARLVAADPAWHLGSELLAAAREGELADLEATRESVAIEHPRWSERDVDEKVAAIPRIAPGAIAGTFDDNPVWDLRAEAAALRVPTMLLTGDPAVFSLVDPAEAEALAAANPLIARRTVPGTGHALHRDDPEATRAALLEWLG